MKNYDELIASIKRIAKSGVADYFNSGNPNSDRMESAATAIQELQAENADLKSSLEHAEIREAKIKKEFERVAMELAASAAPQPLTDAQVESMGMRWVRDGIDLHSFARSIEAAHGITAGAALQPTQDVNAELVEALHEYGRAGVGNSTDWRVQLSALRLATHALSKAAPQGEQQ